MGGVPPVCPLGLGDCSDADGDGAGDPCDCAPFDSTVFAIPGEATNVRWPIGKATIEWDSLAGTAGSASLYDVMRGRTGQWPVGSGPPETCLASGAASTSLNDNSTPSVDSGYYDLVRGENPCGIGSYGFSTGNEERVTAACP